jgi:Piwi domain
LIEALQCYATHNNQQFPDRLIIYRDGVGDGMLEQVRQVEISQFESACALIDPSYKPKITFVVVQKHINTKFFKMLNKMKEGLDDDSSIRRRAPFLITQSLVAISTISICALNMSVKVPPLRRITSSCVMTATLSRTFCRS